MSRLELNKVVKVEEHVRSSHCVPLVQGCPHLLACVFDGLRWWLPGGGGGGGSWEDDQGQEDLAGDGGRSFVEAEAPARAEVGVTGGSPETFQCFPNLAAQGTPRGSNSKYWSFWFSSFKGTWTSLSLQNLKVYKLSQVWKKLMWVIRSALSPVLPFPLPSLLELSIKHLLYSKNVFRLKSTIEAKD